MDTILKQATEDWIGRLDPVGLGVPADRLQEIPPSKIRDFGQATLVCYLPETLELLRKYGKTIILDATHGLVKTNFSTVFMVVYDARGVGEHFTAKNVSNLPSDPFSLQVSPPWWRSHGLKM